MSKKIRSRQGDKDKFKRPEVVGYSDPPAPRIRHPPAYQPNCKRRIERFFRTQCFPEKAMKKGSKGESKPPMKLGHLMAIIDKMRIRVNDQRREHMITLRKLGNRKQ